MTTSIGPKLIKRYANRKLYDTKRSCYVTLEEIAQMVRNGEDVKIVDNKTKEDMTAVTLAQIIFEQEKKLSRMPLSVLRGMIQTSGEALSEFFQRTVTSPVTNFRGEMNKTFEKVFHRTDGSAAEKGGLKSEFNAEEDKHGVVREFVNASGQAIEEWQKRIDEQVHRVVSTMTQIPTLGSDVQTLRQRISKLEQQLDTLDKQTHVQ